MDNIIIAIDGYAATGKSTLAKRLANHLNYVYVDTGAMYRAVTLYILQNGWLDTKISSRNKAIQQLDKVKIRFQLVNKKQHTFLNDKDVEANIRTPEISDRVSEVAAIPEVRNVLVSQQRAMGIKKGIVMDGRDIGTVVFPNAECKFFLTATPEVRAKRRFLELDLAGIDTTFDKVLENVKKRDNQDSSRAVGPLVKAADALLIDVSELTIENAFNALLKVVSSHLLEDD